MLGFSMRSVFLVWAPGLVLVGRLENIFPQVSYSREESEYCDGGSRFVQWTDRSGVGAGTRLVQCPRSSQTFNLLLLEIVNLEA